MSETSVGSERELKCRDLAREIFARLPVLKGSLDAGDRDVIESLMAEDIASAFAAWEKEREAELAGIRASAAEYLQRTDPMLSCGPADDPAAGHCGDCRACALEDRDSLRLLLKEAAEALASSGRAWGDLERGTTQAIERGFTKVHTGDLLIAAKFQRTSCDSALARIRSVLDPEKPEIELAYRALRAQVEGK